MLGKNNQAKLQKLSQDQTVKYKLRKKGKQWFNRTITTTALGIGFFALSTTTIHADVNPVVQSQTNSSPANSDEKHNEHATSEVNHDQVTTQPQTTDQAGTADVHTGSSDDANKQATTKDNLVSDDKQSENTISHDSKENAQQIDKQNPNKTSANNNPSHEQADVVASDTNQVNSSSDDGKVIEHNKSNNQSQEERSNNDAAQPQPSNDDKDKVAAKDELTIQQSADASKDMQASQSSPSDKTSHSDNKEIKVNDDKKQDLDNQKLVNGQAPNGQAKDTDANHQPMTKDDLAKANKDNNVSLLENKLSDQFAGGNHLKLAQMKLAAANNDSNDIPAPDKNGNYNWNNDQFAAAKAKNAVHSGMWGTAQWFIDKNNNLFIGNGELSNDSYSSASNINYSLSPSGDYQRIGTYEGSSDGVGNESESYLGKYITSDHSRISNDSLFDHYSYDNNRFTDLDKANETGNATNNTIHNSDLPYVSPYEEGIGIYTRKDNVYSTKNDTSANGLAASIAKYVGRDNITLNSVNFTSSVNLPKDVSNLFSSHLGNNYSSNYSGYYNYQTRNSIGVAGITRTDNSYMNDYHYYSVDSTTNMGIRKITGYGNMNTSQTENMHNLFGGQAVDPDTSNWDFSSAKDLSNMEAGTHATNLDLSNKDLSKVTDFSNMANTPTLRNANLNNDTISDSANKANMLNGSVQEVSFNSKDTL
ncbi:BspA family leucine-rich repeat surface protein [Apilactobacillus timberlakei]|uniref:BspA family leucine-rich repeat surface protein n=1 Tax=Apilactobacillus timberlakei TaxID=2008380 RepID=UPI00112DDABC|nr:BspA family leucine-rich repeat surface protein [Apilactobacillus timberlakei]TPR13742.1 BspA family leucine-rich repeat surface protein [Apilactobacillus timberlakei]